ncbi:hypothetical protein EDI_194650 [Entamoeba dispar SAW760]|uniref:Uncharacterized protein n=1 Tax=Entamoeba dispar (strain ATCC PRA-260 / SAW760) TaxID=370354 RepID=B0EES3_ENTDS|nr:uncharacterized protein EDI_194650 [Entamoeba dispar SAW760]EDR26956.1 hypothetical protein EDI_194650 [Entamoeba dispar SAW760]|eukprot:EDR26956.1 hypothetical protein EDI_194650 [Entamoeba dispar SAW760]
MLLILFSIVYLVNSQISGCMTDFFVANKEYTSNSFKISFQIDEDYYSFINNYTQVIYGHSVKAGCYVSRNVITETKGNKSHLRYGQCLELVGPTKIPIHCSIVGTFTGTNPSMPQYVYDTLILLPETLYNTIALPTKNMAIKISQVTMREVDCGFSTYPSLYVHSVSNSMANVTLINTNKIIDGIQIGNTIYNNDKWGFYLIPTTSDTISVLSIYSEIIVINNIKFKPSFIYQSNSKFPSNTREHCEFKPLTVLYDENSSKVIHPLLKGYFMQVNSDWSFINHYTNPVFSSVDNHLTAVFAFQSPVQQFDHFSYFEWQAIVSGNYEFMFAYTGLGDLGNPVAKDVVLSCYVSQTTQLKQNYNNTHTLYTIKIFANPRCTIYGNGMTITFYNTSNTVFTTRYAKYVLKPSSQTACSSKDAYCNGMECVPPNVNTSQCGLYCGVCRVGYSCSELGKCVKTISLNTRNSSPSYLFFIEFLMIIILLF